MTRPYVAGPSAVAHGPAAFALSRAISPAQLDAGLERAGLGNERFRELAHDLLAAIGLAGEGWHAEASRRARAGSKPGTSELPGGDAVRSSDEMTETLSTAEAAQVLGRSTRRVRQLIDLGELPGRREGWGWRVSSAAVALRKERTDA